MYRDVIQTRSAGKAKSVCPPARVPRRFRQRKVAPEPTLEDIEEKMRAVEKRKMKELERVRETARSKARLRRPHPAMTSAQATAVKIAAKQAAAGYVLRSSKAEQMASFSIFIGN